ncbi:MAG: 16S rRNA (guanine(966)-N(2))-methyltransferase RsmD [Gammaproteobacteria bacterium]|nr:16S rRNA (guanine(966)-N(2))-methyltransferase RsmD [Gammaproteobacteria bacterium]MDE0284104.1 16S rRNA (guanine(966)-N(2))-methyltransferase RsmD [Gammaproteobacteria bacterium]MDE0513975.1 16S rRNA (guanine(966)-N(2))-methyltransferase RsmD [Gammaproteobacteria bacterium]
MSGTGKIRIIGGQWRGRRLPVTDRPGLRPTPDRVRETLFNWLAGSTGGARCLDLFAGTGALGFEALSRGARCAVMVEQNRELARRLQTSKAALAAASAEIFQAEALAWLGEPRDPFDIVFLDPPFQQDYVKKACALLVNRGHLAPSAYVYTETERGVPSPAPGLKELKQARAGQVEYRLYQRTSEIKSGVP